MSITNNKFVKQLIDIAFITLGAALEAFTLERFLIPNLILDGGVNGISMILGNLTGISISIFVICLNIPFMLLGTKHMGKEFLLKSGYAMIIFSVLLEVFKVQAEVTEDTLLATVYGGVLLGVAVGLIIRFGGCVDGTEVAAIIISKRTNFSLGQVVLAFNFVIYTVAGFLYGLDRALYSLLTYFICYKVIDMVTEGVDQTKAVMIITNQAKEIANDIYKNLGRTVTLMDGEGLINGETKIIYCVITRLELSELRDIVNKDGRQAFMTVSEVAEVYGNHIKKKPKPKKPSKKVEKDKQKEAKNSVEAKA